MTDPASFTAEHRSWEWELVLQYEEGSIPSTAWNVGTLTTIASWYAKNLTPEQATRRYEHAYERNHRRLQKRLSDASVDTKAIESVDAVWRSLLTNALASQKSNPKPTTNETRPE
jgi:hypothetical protein